HVEQQHVLDLAGEHARLDRRADGDGLIRVDVLAGLLAEQRLHGLLDLRHARLTADENDVVDFRDLQARVGQRGLTRRYRFLDEILDERLELRARQVDVQVFRSRRVGRDVRQIDFGLLARRQLDLRLLGRFLEALHRERIAPDVDAALLLKFLREVVDDALVEVLATEERIAVRREHLELMLAVDFRDLDDRDVERAAAQVVHGNLAVAALLVHAIRERRGRGLVDDALDLEARDLARVL